MRGQLEEGRGLKRHRLLVEPDNQILYLFIDAF